MRRAAIKVGVLLMLLLGARDAGADPSVTLRLGSEVPDGTAWARELRNMVREVESASHGSVHVKWYFGAISGDEMETLERIRRGQLDGTTLSAVADLLAPSLRIMRLQGMFRDRDEFTYVLDRLAPLFDAEFRQAGFVKLGYTILGPSVLLSRTPVRTLAAMRRMRIWRWDLDRLATLQDRAMGLQIVPTPVEEASAAYDQGRIDGLLAVPTAAVAFQWTARTHYVTPLRADFLLACFVLSTRSFDRLSVDQQQELRSAAARVSVREEALNRGQNELLLHSLFAEHGIRNVPASAELKSDFEEAARFALEQLAPRLRIQPLVARVRGLVEEYRAQQAKAR